MIVPRCRILRFDGETLKREWFTGTLGDNPHDYRPAPGDWLEVREVTGDDGRKIDESEAYATMFPNKNRAFEAIATVLNQHRDHNKQILAPVPEDGRWLVGRDMAWEELESEAPDE